MVPSKSLPQKLGERSAVPWELARVHRWLALKFPHGKGSVAIDGKLCCLRFWVGRINKASSKFQPRCERRERTAEHLFFAYAGNRRGQSARRELNSKIQLPTPSCSCGLGRRRGGFVGKSLKELEVLFSPCCEGLLLFFASLSAMNVAVGIGGRAGRTEGLASLEAAGGSL